MAAVCAIRKITLSTFGIGVSFSRAFYYRRIYFDRPRGEISAAECDNALFIPCVVDIIDLRCE